MGGARIALVSGRLEVAIAPSLGGAITAFDWRGEDRRFPVLRRSPKGCLSVLDSSSFPLVPFVNRIRNGRFVFANRQIRLTANMDGDPSPLHGQGWLNPWTVESSGPKQARLQYRHEPGEWPWRYSAVHDISLDDDGLSLDLECRNLADEAMPCGLGQHPYFPCGPETRIVTQTDHVWTVDDNVLPVERIAATGRFDLQDRRICGQDLDNGFDGWSGQATIRDPDWPFVIRLASPDADFFQVYSPAGGGFFAAEPVSHANAALNAPERDWARLGLRILGPGEAMKLHMRLEVTAA